MLLGLNKAAYRSLATAVGVWFRNVSSQHANVRLELGNDWCSYFRAQANVRLASRGRASLCEDGVNKSKLSESVIAGASAFDRPFAIMGICNVTPDSFSDGGAYFSLKNACDRVDTLLAEGANIIDIGGESTRPGAKPVSTQEQLSRVLEVVRYASKKTIVSIDTTDPEVARACLAKGATLVNDVSCLRNSELATVVAEAGATLVLMHSRETADGMHASYTYPENGYDDVVSDVLREWEQGAERARACGVTRLIMDPGLGFAKSAKHSTEVLRRTREFVDRVEVPVLIGASRKSFLKVVDGDAGPNDRIGASISAAMFAIQSGAEIVRVHDVRATRQALELHQRLLGALDA